MTGHRTAFAAALACLVTAAEAAAAIDLLPALTHAEICPDGGGACVPPRDAVAVHQPPGTDPGVARLPPGTRSHLYLRVPSRAATLHLEVAGAGVVVSVETDDTPERELHRAGSGAVTIDLSSLAGQIVRLGLHSAPDGQGTEVRRALLDGPPDPSPGESLVGGALPSRPNVVVYVIDTLRADHLGCYGYARPTTPRIDAFAGSALRFTRAVAQSSWTLPSIASILTGLAPPAHGAVGPENGIRPDVPTLAELLRGQGYATAAFVTNYLGSGVFGLDRGFATYRFYRERGDGRASVYLASDALGRRILRWLARRPPEPFLLYVHATDPHFPYGPPRRFARPFVSTDAARRLPALVEAARPLHNGRDAWGTRPAPLAPADVAALRDAYDADVRMADEYFGRMLDALGARGLLERTLVVLTSDHGEEFFEHRGVAHGQTLYAEALHVPLLVRLPGGRAGGRTVDTLAQHADIVPTIVDVAGLAAPAGLAGSSLVRGRPASVEAHAALALGPFTLDGLIADRWKVIRDQSRPDDRRFEVYVTDRDPGDRIDLAADSSVLVGYARTRLHDLAAPRPPGPAVPEDRLERLRALGYVAD